MSDYTIKLGKRGTLVLPAKVRQQFGLTDGALLRLEAKNGEIVLRPSFTYEPEVWSDETRAYFILINSLTKEAYDAGLPEVLSMGIDPAKIKGLAPNLRDTLPNAADWNAEMSRIAEKMSA